MILVFRIWSLYSWRSRCRFQSMQMWTGKAVNQSVHPEVLGSHLGPRVDLCWSLWRGWLFNWFGSAWACSLGLTWHWGHGNGPVHESVGASLLLESLRMACHLCPGGQGSSGTVVLVLDPASQGLACCLGWPGSWVCRGLPGPGDTVQVWSLGPQRLAGYWSEGSAGWATGGWLWGWPGAGVHGEVSRLLTPLAFPHRNGFSLHMALPELRGRVTWVVWDCPPYSSMHLFLLLLPGAVISPRSLSSCDVILVHG